MANIWYAVKLARRCDASDRGWLVQPSPAEYSAEFGASIWYDTDGDAQEALERAGLLTEDHQLVRLSTQLKSNHYRMLDVPWPF